MTTIDLNLSDLDRDGSLTFHDVPWDLYRSLRDQPQTDHLRMSYLDGTLIAVSPGFLHDRRTELLGHVVRGGRPSTPVSTWSEPISMHSGMLSRPLPFPCCWSGEACHRW